MFLLFSTASVWLGILSTLACTENVYACGLNNTANDRHVDERGRSHRKLRGILEDNGGFAFTAKVPDVERPACGSPKPTKNEVLALATTVDRFYREESLGGNRRLQDTIVVNVNFVVVLATNGLGATQGLVLAQIDKLNDAFYPDFEFNLAEMQVVTSDQFFGGIDYNDPNRALEVQMKSAYKRGGMETLNVYAVDPVGTIGGWAFYPYYNFGASDVLDGVVIDYTSLPGGGHWFFTEGAVSIEHASRRPLLESIFSIPSLAD
jgi:hypothetical protein